MAIPTYNSAEIPVLSVPPDWSVAVKWRQSYSTTITESLNGTEERQTRYPRALYGLEFRTMCLTAAETAYLRALLEKHSDILACPLWPLACRLTAAVAAGASSLEVDDPRECLLVLHDTAGYPLDKAVFHEYALLWQAWDHWEVIELSTVSPEGEVVLAANLAKAYTAAALLLPLIYGHAPRGNIEQLTDEHGQWECKFREVFHRLHDQSVPEDTVMTFDGSTCAVLDIEDGGGDTFDCYDAGENVITLPAAGTGMYAAWRLADNPFQMPLGDEFDSYASVLGADSSTMTAGTGFFDTWRLSPDASPIEPLASAFSGFSTAAEATVALPGATQFSRMLVLVLMRRAAVTAITGGLANWTLIAEKKATATTAEQWTSVYTKPFAGETSITVTEASSVRIAFVVLPLWAASSIVVESTNTGMYDAAVNPGLHPVPALTAAGNGRLGLFAETCVLSLTSSVAHTLAAPWAQLVPSPLNDHRMQVGTRQLSSGQSIAETTGVASHAVANHNGAEVSAIFKTT